MKKNFGIAEQFQFHGIAEAFFLLLIHDILKNSFLWDCGAVSISWYYSGAIFFRFVLLLILDLTAIGY